MWLACDEWGTAAWQRTLLVVVVAGVLALPTQAVRCAGGAPRTGTSEWDSRMAKGMDTLLDNTINGYKGMPPLGMCMDCGEEEFEALIRFMAGEQ